MVSSLAYFRLLHGRSDFYSLKTLNFMSLSEAKMHSLKDKLREEEIAEKEAAEKKLREVKPKGKPAGKGRSK